LESLTAHPHLQAHIIMKMAVSSTLLLAIGVQVAGALKGNFLSSHLPSVGHWWKSLFPHANLFENRESDSKSNMHAFTPVDQADQPLQAGRNLCMQGKKVPDFYVLGAMKSATTSLSDDLRYAGVNNTAGCGWETGPDDIICTKEFHFFDYIARGLNHTATRSKFLDLMEDCEENDAPDSHRQVLADYNPNNLRIVPVTHKYVYNYSDVNDSVPSKLYQLYGDEMASKLQFAVLLREPLSQMQSSWYMLSQFNSSHWEPWFAAPNFRTAVKMVIDGLEATPQQLTQWQWYSMYSRHIERWTAHFPKSSFLIIPMKQYTHGGESAVCRKLSKRLGYAMNCNTEGHSAHQYSHKHPAVDEDAGKDLRDKFDQLMMKEKQRLVHVLTQGHREGMTLVGFDGKVGDEKAVERWLVAGW